MWFSRKFFAPLLIKESPLCCYRFSATHYEDNVPTEVKQRRLDELMILQQDISSEIEADKEYL